MIDLFENYEDSLKKGTSPHKRSNNSSTRRVKRGGQPVELIKALYLKQNGSFKDNRTAEDPGEFFMEHGLLYSMVRTFTPKSIIEWMEFDPSLTEEEIKADPNKYDMVSPNHRGWILDGRPSSMDASEQEICSHCLMNTWEFFKLTGMAIKLENHHNGRNKFMTVKVCATCHAATPDHAVNDDKQVFDSRFLKKLLDDQQRYSGNQILKIMSGKLFVPGQDYKIFKRNPKLTMYTLQNKFYGAGLHRYYGYRFPVPGYLKQFFVPNTAKDVFNLGVGR